MFKTMSSISGRWLLNIEFGSQKSCLPWREWEKFYLSVAGRKIFTREFAGMDNKALAHAQISPPGGGI